jgi:hypothetical protein
MEYGCSCCEYISDKKENITKHFSRKKSCGSGIKEIIEIPIEIICKYCDKNFSCSKSLKYHQKNSCKTKTTILEERNKELEKKNKELEKKLKEKPATTINNNQTINIYINNYENTNLEKLTDKIYNRIIQDAELYQIIPRLIKNIHFNPEIPENHNLRISNRGRSNKYLEVYRNNQWEIEDKKSEIDNIINDKETNLSDWIDAKGEKYPEAVERFNEYKEQKFEDEELVRLIKEEIEKTLYNNRNLTKD